MQDKRKKAYIDALVRLITENPEASSTYIDSFTEVLRERGEEKLIAPVLKVVKERLGESVSLSVTVALGDEDNKTKEAALGAVREMNLNEKNILVYTDTTLIGGYRVTTQNKLVDASFKGALLTLYKNLTR